MLWAIRSNKEKILEILSSWLNDKYNVNCGEVGYYFLFKLSKQCIGNVLAYWQ